MLRTFNNGIGLALVVAEEHEADVLLRLQGLQEQGYVIGKSSATKKRRPAAGLCVAPVIGGGG